MTKTHSCVGGICDVYDRHTNGAFCTEFSMSENFLSPLLICTAGKDSHPYWLNYPNFDNYIEIVQCSSYGIASLWYIHPKGWPTLPSLQYFLILFKRGGGWGVGVTPMFKKNFRIRNSVTNALVKA